MIRKGAVFKYESEEERERAFWLHIDKHGPIPAHCVELGHCWIWLGYLDKANYGRISSKYWPTSFAHRLVWILTFGQIKKGICVLHKCDNPSCVNPDHLFLGTQLQNIEDRDKKLRFYHKLTIEQAASIKREYVFRVNGPALAKKYQIDIHIIHDIAKGKKWKCLL